MTPKKRDNNRILEIGAIRTNVIIVAHPSRRAKKRLQKQKFDSTLAVEFHNALFLGSLVAKMQVSDSSV